MYSIVAVPGCVPGSVGIMFRTYVASVYCGCLLLRAGSCTTQVSLMMPACVGQSLSTTVDKRV